MPSNSRLIGRKEILCAQNPRKKLYPDVHCYRHVIHHVDREKEKERNHILITLN